MNAKQKENLLKWADVLESGEYEQVHGVWGGHHRGAYCCLNVALCHFTGKEYSTSDDPMGQIRNLFGKDIDVDAYYKMNDSYKYTFKQIATEIRNRVEGYA